MVEEHQGTQHKRRMVIPGAWPESPSPPRRRRGPVPPSASMTTLSPLRHRRTTELARDPTSPTPVRSAPVLVLVEQARSSAVSIAPSAPTTPTSLRPSTTRPSTPAPAPRRQEVAQPLTMPIVPSLEPLEVTPAAQATPVATSASRLPAPEASREHATRDTTSGLAEAKTPAVSRTRRSVFQRTTITTTLSPKAGRPDVSPQTPAAKRNDGPRGILKRPKESGQHRRRVHFNEEMQFMQFCKPYPSKIKEYTIGGICGELPSPLNRRSFQVMQNAVVEASPARSDMSSPDRRPAFSDSPVRPMVSWMRPRSSSETSSSSVDQLDIAAPVTTKISSAPEGFGKKNVAASTAAWVNDVQSAAAMSKDDQLDELSHAYGLFSLSRPTDTTRRTKLQEERAAAQAAAAAELARLEAERLAEEAAHRIVTPLSADWTTKLDTAMATRDPFKSLVGNLTRKDFGTLLPQNRADGVGWLNDEIVNGYLAAIVSKAQADYGYTKGSTPRVHAFNTALYTTYQAKGYDGVKRWAQRAKLDGIRLFSVDCLLIPINDGLHWTLLAISGKERTIRYFDSLYEKPEKYTGFARAFVAGVLAKEYKEEDWLVVDASSSQQANGLDCGVFVCMNALALVLGRDPVRAFGAGEVAAARRMVGAVLLNGGMKDEFAVKFYD